MAISTTASTASTQYITIGNNTTIAYRFIGPPPQDSRSPPLLLNMHYRGNMTHWDPRFLDTLSRQRPVLIFDAPGTGLSTGTIPTTFSAWASNALALVSALKLARIDVAGFSMGGAAAQMIALNAPKGLVRKLVLLGTGPSAPPEELSEADVSRLGIAWPRDQPPSEAIVALSKGEAEDDMREGIRKSFYYDDERGRHAFEAYWARIKGARNDGIFKPVGLEGSERQRLAWKDWSIWRPENSWGRLNELDDMEVLIMNGDMDLLIPTSRSWELYRMIRNAKLIIYPRSGHGFLWQYENVGSDINRFLDGEEFDGTGKTKL